MRDRRLVIVTDLGIVAKRAVDGGRDVFVQSIASGQPVSGAQVEIWGRNGGVLSSQETDSQGRAQQNLRFAACSSAYPANSPVNFSPSIQVAPSRLITVRTWPAPDCSTASANASECVTSHT